MNISTATWKSADLKSSLEIMSQTQNSTTIVSKTTQTSPEMSQSPQKAVLSNAERRKRAKKNRKTLLSKQMGRKHLSIGSILPLLQQEAQKITEEARESSPESQSEQDHADNAELLMRQSSTKTSTLVTESTVSVTKKTLQALPSQPLPPVSSTPSSMPSPSTLHYTLDTIPKHLKKYWNKRHSLFHKYDHDQGIWMDEEGWYSVTPETLARYHAERIGKPFDTLTVIDAFCGVGGNTIQLALSPKVKKVIAVDVDPVKIKCAQHNAQVYHVPEGKIEWICGDILQVLKNIKVDVIFASPPWGGPDYLKMSEYSLEHHMNISGINGLQLFRLMYNITQNVCFFIPRNTILNQVASLTNPIEVEEQQLNNRCVAWCVWTGKLITKDRHFETLEI